MSFHCLLFLHLWLILLLLLMMMMLMMMMMMMVFSSGFTRAAEVEDGA